MLDVQLDAISSRIILLGTLVETALSQALQAVQSGDQALRWQDVISGFFRPLPRSRET